MSDPTANKLTIPKGAALPGLVHVTGAMVGITADEMAAKMVAKMVAKITPELLSQYAEWVCHVPCEVCLRKY